MRIPPCILTIAGSDPSGGAGIQADIKTFSMLGTYGASVLTSLTAQNTSGVDAIHAPPRKFIAQQLRSVLTDINIKAAKTGMLYSKDVIDAVAPFLQKKRFPLVVDPVSVSTSGHTLLEDSAVSAMVKQIFPYADLLTPNLPETELFTGIRITRREHIAQAAKKLLALGAKAVLIKGGHNLSSMAVTDWLVIKGQAPLPLMQARIKTKNTHGTGCTLSAAIAAYLGLGKNMTNAIIAAQEYLNLALRASFKTGKEGGSPNFIAPILREQSREKTLVALESTGFELETMAQGAQLLAGQGNLALALQWGSTINDVASFHGGLIESRCERIRLNGAPCFGNEDTATIALLSARRVRPEIHCLLNVRFTEASLRAAKKAGVKIAVFRWDKQPTGLSTDELGVLDWGVREAIISHPDPSSVGIVYDRGTQGICGNLRILGKNCTELMAKVCAILNKM